MPVSLTAFSNAVVGGVPVVERSFLRLAVAAAPEQSDVGMNKCKELSLQQEEGDRLISACKRW